MLAGPRRSALVLLVAAVLVVGACGRGSDPGAAPSADPPTTTEAPPAPVEDPAAPAGPRFEARIVPVPAEVRARMDGRSMRPDCPIGYDALRYVTLTHHDFEGGVRTGELVVHAGVAGAVVEVFRTLFAEGFPIRRMVLVDDFGADDFAAIEADTTSAFNCRRNRGEPGWSDHSWGWAIDINPIENPFITAEGTTYHPASEPYLDRSRDAPGVILAGGPVVEAFAEVGWSWGGVWRPEPDTQHLSLTGR